METFRKGIGVCALVVLGASLVQAQGTGETDLSLEVEEGTLEVVVANTVGNPVASPKVVFDSIQTDFIDNETTGTLGDLAAGTTPHQLLVKNPRDEEQWELRLDTAGGNGATWSDGSNTMDFNGAAAESEGRLTINSTTGEIGKVVWNPANGEIQSVDTAGGCCTSLELAASEFTFTDGGGDTLLFQAVAGADDFAGFVLRDVEVRQNIPQQQPAGSYVLDMVLTVS